MDACVCVSTDANTCFIPLPRSTCELPATNSLKEKEFCFNPLQQGGTTRGISFSPTHFIHFFSSLWVRKGDCRKPLKARTPCKCKAGRQRALGPQPPAPPHTQSRPRLLSEALPFEEVPRRNPELRSSRTTCGALHPSVALK